MEIKEIYIRGKAEPIDEYRYAWLKENGLINEDDHFLGDREDCDAWLRQLRWIMLYEKLERIEALLEKSLNHPPILVNQNRHSRNSPFSQPL